MLDPTDLTAGLQNYNGGTQQAASPEAIVRALQGRQMAMMLPPGETSDLPSPDAPGLFQQPFGIGSAGPGKGVPISPDFEIQGRGYREGFESALDDKMAGTRVTPYPGDHPYTRGWREGYEAGMRKR